MVTVIHQQQYLFRGLVDEKFIRKAVAHFQGGIDLDISAGEAYPKQARFESADNAALLEKILRDDCFGSFVWIWPDPYNVVPNLFSLDKQWSEDDMLVIRIPPPAKP